MGKAAKRYAEKADTEYAYDSEAFRAAVGKAQRKKFLARVRAYWNGERDQHP